MTKTAKALLLVLALTGAPVAASAAERRCGWVDNPTPQNYWLTDREREWAFSIQGGEVAEGLDEAPDFRERGWVETNGSYGYGCACMTVETDRRAERITRIISARSRPLKQCRADRRLPRR